jgi:hypothetical protein
MNFNDLFKKMVELDAPTIKQEPQQVEEVVVENAVDPIVQLRRDLGLEVVSESTVEECGDMPMMASMGGMGASPSQQDNVSMNVSLNGSGSGGIKDLMNILKGIEDNADGDVEVAIAGSDVDDLENAFDEEFANSPDEQVQPVDAVLPTGDDLHGQGAEAPKVNGGGNPMQETLKLQLSRLYTEIQEGEKFDALKHVKNPTKGEKTAAKDVKRGSYADRAAMLKSAEADGRLKK